MAKIVQTAGRNALGEFAPEFAHFNDDVLFGENWNNQDIDEITGIFTMQRTAEDRSSYVLQDVDTIRKREKKPSS